MTTGITAGVMLLAMAINLFTGVHFLAGGFLLEGIVYLVLSCFLMVALVLLVDALEGADES